MWVVNLCIRLSGGWLRGFVDRKVMWIFGMGKIVCLFMGLECLVAGLKVLCVCELEIN